MNILVTGGAGRVGNSAVARLIRGGHSVRVIGRSDDLAIEGAEYRRCDVTDYAGLREQTRGMDAVVHLAAIPNPEHDSCHEIFRINCSGTFNVFHAAAEEGIRRVVCASSINALGYTYGIKGFELRYFPIDEDHPTYTTDSYSFSKQIMEETAAYFWRREGISSVCLRLPAVVDVTGQFLDWKKHALSWFREAWDLLLAEPVEERERHVRLLIDEFEAGRVKRMYPRPRNHHYPGHHRHRHWNIPKDRFLIYGGSGRSDFWTVISAEDSAQAIEKGVTAEYEGSHPLFVNDKFNTTGIESELLARTLFPDVSGRKRPLRGLESLVSIDRARALIGFEPENSFLSLLESHEEHDAAYPLKSS